jgi:hypothetical protein
MDTRTPRCIPAALLALLLATPALAVDGVIEINQAKALAGGLSANDFPGFPVTIEQAGSYRLTGDLSVPGGLEGLQILTDHVTVDLNGFSVVGGGGPIADGIALYGHSDIEIRNGTVRGFSRAGIFGNVFTSYARVIGVRALSNFQGMELQGPGHLVEGCTAAGNSSTGIRVMDGGVITRSVARGNGSFGLLLSPNAGYGGNVLTGNNGGDANAQVAGGGIQLSTNVCGTDAVCP